MCETNKSKICYESVHHQQNMLTFVNRAFSLRIYSYFCEQKFVKLSKIHTHTHTQNHQNSQKAMFVEYPQNFRKQLGDQFLNNLMTFGIFRFLTIFCFDKKNSSDVSVCAGRLSLLYFWT